MAARGIVPVGRLGVEAIVCRPVYALGSSDALSYYLAASVLRNSPVGPAVPARDHRREPTMNAAKSIPSLSSGSIHADMHACAFSG